MSAEDWELGTRQERRDLLHRTLLVGHRSNRRLIAEEFWLPLRVATNDYT
jgi:hypothetical protein